MKLLIVDDEPIIRRGIKSLIDLEALCIEEVYEASNGEQALELFKEELPDIVLADINMPRLNGLEFAKQIRQVSPKVKIAMITGYDYFDYALKALKIGVDDYVLKPVSRTDIESLLYKFVEAIKEEKNKEVTEKLVRQFKEVYEIEGDKGYKTLILKQLEVHMNQPYFSLTYLSDQMGLSAGYLSGLFKKLFGQSFKAYVLDKRLEEAKIMLLSTEMRNYEVGEKVGFEDSNYFSTAFKKKYGCSPRQYREEAGNK